MNDAQHTEPTRGASHAAGLIGAMQERAQLGFDQISVAAKDAIDDIAVSGATDRMRGYANEAVGRAKMALGLAARSPELTMAGLAQIAVGGVQRAIGEAKGEDETGEDGAEDMTDPPMAVEAAPANEAQISGSAST